MDVDYQSLLKWRIEESLPDQWYVSIDGSAPNELFSLLQIKEMYDNLSDSTIFVKNYNHAQNPDSEWYTYSDEHDCSDSGVVTSAWVFAFLLPIVAMIMAITFYSHRDRKKHASDILVTSIFVQLVYAVITSLLLYRDLRIFS